MVCQISYVEKVYDKMFNNKQSEEEILIERAVKTIQIQYDTGLFDNYDIADEVLKNYLLSQRRRPDLEDLNDDVVKIFYS